MRNFNDLSEREVLALAISLEEEDERVYADFAEGLKDNYPASGSLFDAMRKEESNHRRRLLDLYREKFGEHIPPIRRQDVKGLVQRRPIWLVRPLGLDIVRKQASAIEVETRRFYEKAAGRSKDVHARPSISTISLGDTPPVVRIALHAVRYPRPKAAAWVSQPRPRPARIQTLHVNHSAQTPGFHRFQKLLCLSMSLDLQ